ncbi:N-acetylglucosamine-6-phosphate deacetylase [Natronohydrobacter thiooxidans]|uniref:N-acetylglucosamine-6-phosphate deacetylase n=1 Tax=Natronohydrobacter thiooxidans TaxID=87172 RepID=UPI0008FF6D08|nr:N-acetylglucosamine-6-phosphate deacetylase [Natronohydrobacter thiooxidans]
MIRVFKAAHVFDGWALHRNAAVSVTANGEIAALHLEGGIPPGGAEVTDFGAGILAPGFVDLQVNGGDGVMVGPDTDTAQLARICAAHMRLGATAILPTLISDTPETTRRVIEAGIAAARQNLPGFAGLHLEGPHLDPARKGAHDPAFLRPMTESDLDLLCAAAQKLPALLVTLAPESATLDQIAALSRAGVIVSLGHSDCSAEQARAAHAAGARCVTHLYNAMGALANRSPGLVGAALTTPFVAGIIADGVHVAPECLQVALAMKSADTLFLVSDAMAVAGSSADQFTLNGRRILRRQNRLTLEDGTLAGADISLPQSVRHLVGLGVDTTRALAMASRIPADIIHAQDRGRMTPGARADFVVLTPDLELTATCRSGALASE